jgi:hypothetical protein
VLAEQGLPDNDRDYRLGYGDHRQAHAQLPGLVGALVEQDPKSADAD